MKKLLMLSVVCAASLFAGDLNITAEDKDMELFLDDVVVDATRNHMEINKYAGSVTVLDEQRLKTYSNVMDSIKLIPGVDTGYSRGREIGNNFSIRGFGYQSEERVIIMQDGIGRSPSLFSNMISSFRTDSDILKRVEVTKGASSILHGSGAIGGIVSMKTKNAKDYLKSDEYYGAMLGQRLESNNMRSTRAAAYAKGEEVPFDVLVYGKRAKYGDIDLAKGGTSEKTYDDEEVTTIFLKTGLDIGDSHRVEASYYDYKNSLNTMWQTLWQNPSDGDLFVNGELKQRDFSFDYFYRPLNDYIDLSFKFYKSDASYRRGYDITQRTGRTIMDYENEDERWGINVKNISRFETGPIKHSLVVGVDYVDRTEDALMLQNGKKSDIVSMPADYKDLGIYLQNVMTYDKFELTLGGRFDHFDRSADDKDYDKSRFSPRIAASYELFPNFRLLAGYAETFRAPTPHETASSGPLNRMYWYVPNPGLDAEIAKEYEIGASYQGFIADGHYLNVKGMYFDGDIKDMISIITLKDMGTPPGGFSQNYGQYVNIDDASRKGFEISANYINDYFGLYASYEHMKLKNKQTGKRIKNFADKLVVGMEAYFPNDITLGFDVSHWFKPDLDEKSYTSRGTTYYYVDNSYTIVNFKGNIEFDNLLSGATLNFGVNNIFNDKYVNANLSAQDGKFAYVGKGRNAYLDFEVRF
ncbi:MAG: TonB-dependent receptor [Campylobacteraceae bacterium]|nr:TonB-dependent receptor [Campylobacteraceae bacterium]